MTPMEAFKQSVADAQAGTYYRQKWVPQNDALADLWFRFRDAILAGGRPSPPDMQGNKFGASLVDYGVQYLVNTVAPTPTPTPDPTPSPTPDPTPTPTPVKAIPFGYRLDGAYFKAKGSPNGNDGPWCIGDPHPNNYDLIVTDGVKKPTAIQWGGGWTAWPPSAYDVKAADLARSVGAFSMYDFSMPVDKIVALANGDATVVGLIKQLAQQIKNHGHPLIFRPLWEMNGGWFPWGKGKMADADFVKAWQNMWHAFAQVMSADGSHTGNATFFFCPNIILSGDTATIKARNPGDAFYDLIGFDGYMQDPSPYISPGALFDPTYSLLASISARPIGIGEFGVTAAAVAPGKGAWFDDFFQKWVPSKDRLAFLNYFNEAGNPPDPHFELPESARVRWVAGIGGAKFKANVVNAADYPNGTKVPL